MRTDLSPLTCLLMVASLPKTLRDLKTPLHRKAYTRGYEEPFIRYQTDRGEVIDSVPEHVSVLFVEGYRIPDESPMS